MDHEPPTDLTNTEGLPQGHPVTDQVPEEQAHEPSHIKLHFKNVPLLPEVSTTYSVPSYKKSTQEGRRKLSSGA